MGIKHQGKKAKTKILKERRVKISEEEREEIIEELIRTQKVRVGQSIDYAQFLELYEPYKEKLNEQEFAEILGISYPNYMGIKHQGKKAKTNDYRDKGKIDRIKYVLGKRTGYYTEDELETLVKKYNISIEEIIQYILCRGYNEEYTQAHINILKRKGKIWIGKTECSKEFADKCAQCILRNAEKFSKMYSNRYNCKYLQMDLASDSIMYILQNCGDIEKNLGDNIEISKKIIILRIRIYIKYNCINQLKPRKEKSFYGVVRDPKNNMNEINVFDRGIKDESQDIESKVMEKMLDQQDISKEESIGGKYAKLLMKNINKGLTLDQALRKMENDMGLSQEDILKELRKYMIETKKVKETEKGEFILGE